MLPRAVHLLERIASTCRQAVHTAKKLEEPIGSDASRVKDGQPRSSATVLRARAKPGKNSSRCHTDVA